MRRWLFALVLMTAPLLPAGGASANVTVPTVQGRVIYNATMNTAARTTTIDELFIVGLEPASTGKLSWGCSECEYTLTADADGVVQLTKGRAYLYLSEGETWTVTLADPHGRSRTIVYRTRRGTTPEIVSRTCAGTLADGSSTPIPCEVDCNTNQLYPAGDPCVDAGGIVSIPNGRIERSFTGGANRTRIKRLRVSGVPAGATVIVICRGPGTNVGYCYFGLKVLRPRNGRVDVGRLFAGTLKPRTQIMIWLVRGNERGDVARYTMRKGKPPRFEKLCMPAIKLEPTRC